MKHIEISLSCYESVSGCKWTDYGWLGIKFKLPFNKSIPSWCVRSSLFGLGLHGNNGPSLLIMRGGLCRPVGHILRRGDDDDDSNIVPVLEIIPMLITFQKKMKMWWKFVYYCQSINWFKEFDSKERFHSMRMLVNIMNAKVTVIFSLFTWWTDLDEIQYGYTASSMKGHGQSCILKKLIVSRGHQ